MGGGLSHGSRVQEDDDVGRDRARGERGRGPDHRRSRVAEIRPVSYLAGSSVTTVVRSGGKYLVKASLTEASVSELIRSTRVAMIAGSWRYMFTALNRFNQ